MAGAAETAEKPAVTQHQHFKINNLYGANLGVEMPRRISTALNKAADVDAELSRYQPPDCFGAAVDRLSERHVLVLQGRPGLGRYTGALALLRQRVPGDLTPISPATPLDELKEYAFEAGAGYYVLDYGLTESGPKTEFNWTSTCAAVRNAGAYLVVTTTAASRYAAPVDWYRPELGKLLRALLGDGAAGLAAEHLDRIPADWSPTDIAELARRLRAGTRPEEALAVFDLTATAEVDAWFAEPARTWADFVEVAALAFVGGAGPRQFESLVAGLEKRAAAYLPAVEPTEEDRGRAVDRAVNRRRMRSPLIVGERVTHDGIPRQMLTFRSAAHRQQVIHALWDTQAVAFWDGVRDWLHELVAQLPADPDDALLGVAEGIVMLARANAEEALDSYLEPFAAYACGENGSDCASAVLRLMSLDDAMAPMALQTAVRWVPGPVPQRLAAGAALMTELGVRYPQEAARRLWQLIAQDDELDEFSYTGPGFQLEALAALDGDPMPLLTMLDGQLSRLAKPRVTPRMVDLVLCSIAGLLGARQQGTGRLVNFELLVRRPETAGVLGRLWAGVLANRRYRTAALGTVWDGMFAAADRDTLAEALTRALDPLLGPADQTRFVRDFTVIDQRKRHQNRKRADSLAHLLIDAMARIHGETPLEKA